MFGLLKREPAVAATGGIKERLTIGGLLQQIKYLQHSYPLGLQMSMNNGPVELPELSYDSFAEIYRKSGPIFALILARMALFSEARFQYQRFEEGRPGELYGGRKLKILEKPWVNGTTGEMLARAEQDVSLSGNWYLYWPDRKIPELRRLRPDWITIVMGSKLEVQDISKAIDARVIEYYYEPPGEQRIRIKPEDMVHWSPIPDPKFNYRGMSWIPAALSDASADLEATEYRVKFFRNSATANFVVLPDKELGIEEFKDFRDDFVEHYEGSLNAFKTIFMGGGSDIKVLGLDFEKMDFRNIQGAGETRMASVAGVPPIVAGFSQGLEAATYSNYGQARRKFGDMWARPQWRSAAGVLEKFSGAPRGSRLWYDDRDIPALREDLGDEADIRTKDAATVKVLIDAGYKPDAAVDFVRTSNLGMLLGKHSGRVSVQLNPIEGDDDEDGGNDQGGGEEVEDEEVDAEDEET